MKPSTWILTLLVMTVLLSPCWADYMSPYQQTITVSKDEAVCSGKSAYAVRRDVRYGKIDPASVYQNNDYKGGLFIGYVDDAAGVARSYLYFGGFAEDIASDEIIEARLRVYSTGSDEGYRRADIGEYRINYRVNDDTLEVLLIGKRNDDEVYRRFFRR